MSRVNDNDAKKWDAIAIERGGPKIMTGSPYSYYSRDSGSPYPYNIGDQGPQYHMDMGTRDPQNGGSPFSHDTGIYAKISVSGAARIREGLWSCNPPPKH